MTKTTVRDGVGVSVRRPDGIPKVKGEFAYSSDMWAEDMLWGATLRSPHPRARILSINLGPALAIPGVHAVLTHEDVPGRKTYGLEHHDQPVLAFSEVRYQGEPVAVVAADHPETARRAADRIEVTYEELEPLVDPEYALDPPLRRCIRRATCCATSTSPTATSPPRPTSWCPASTRSGCRTRPSWGRSPGSRSRPRTAASTSGSPPSGCTWTATRSRPAWTCRWRRSASRSRASAARSAGARTSRCRPTPACSPCTPAGR